MAPVPSWAILGTVTVPDVHEVVHAVVPDLATARTLLDGVCADSELAVALLDVRLACVWANSALRTRAEPFVHGVGLEGLVVSSGAVPRWSRTTFEVVRQLPLATLDLERGRDRLSFVIVPLMDTDGQVIGMVGVAPQEGVTSGELVSRASWSRWLDPSDIGVLVSDLTDRVVLASSGFVEGVGRLPTAQRCTDQILERTVAGDQESLLAAKWTFLSGRPVAGCEDVELEAVDTNQRSWWRQTWMSVAVEGSALLRIDLFARIEGERADSTWGRVSEALQQAVTLTQSCPEPLLLLDRNRVVGASAACETRLGRAPESMVGMELEQLVVGDGLWEELLEDIGSGRLVAATRAEVRVLHGNGERVVAELSVAPAVQGAPGRAVVLIRCLEADRVEEDIGTLTTMLSVSEVVGDFRGRITEPLDLIREAFRARSIELLTFDPTEVVVLERYRAPPEAPGSQHVLSAKMLADLHGLLSMTGGPVLLDAAQTGFNGQLAVQHLPTRHDTPWIVLVEVDRPWTVHDRQRLRRLVQVQAWIVERVSREQRTEELYRERMLLARGLDCASVGVVVSDAAGVVIATNEALERLVGRSDLEGAPLSSLVAPRDRQSLAARFAGDAPGEVWEGELVHTVGWTEPIALRLVLELMTMPDGSLVGAVGWVTSGVRNGR